MAPARLVWPCVLTTVLAAALTACSGGGNSASSAPSGNSGGASAPAAVEVGVVEVQPQALALQTSLAGRTLASQVAEIRPQVSGLVQAQLFSEGTQVQAGQPLYQLDDASTKATLASAQAALAKAEATAQAAKLKAQRQSELLQADAGSRQDAEDAQAALAQALAEVKSASAAVTTARIDQTRTRITAPISGRVDTSSVTAGALVTANQTAALTTIQRMDPMWVDMPQNSVEVLKLRQQLSLGKLQSGELTVQLQLEDGSTYAHPAQLQVSGVTVNATTGAVVLRARVPNPDGVLLPGMYVRAVLDLAKDPAALLVPQAGVSRNARGEASALVVLADGKVEQRPVTVAQSLQGRWRVTQGLNAGDRVIVEGTGKVKPGQIVHAVALSPEAATRVAQASPTAMPASPAPTPAQQAAPASSAAAASR